MVYMIYNHASFALINKADGSIKSIKDLEGKALGSPEGGVAFKLFTALD